MITRSLGIHPGLPWAGPLPGGGFDGKTKRLDRAVRRFSTWLQTHFACPVQIRFNSHRLSGGAFIYPTTPNKLPMMDAPEIGLGARLITKERERERAHNAKAGIVTPPEWEEGWSENTPLAYNLLVYPQFLRDPADLGEYKPGDTFGYWTVATPQAAYSLLRRLVKDGLL